MDVLIGASLITLLVFLLWRMRRAVRASSAYAAFAKRAAPSDYHAVHIQFCEEGACTEVRQHRDKRYLANQAPALPLEYCSADECNCRYSHYDDRRKIMKRRAVDNGFDARPYDGPERREEDERRNHGAAANGAAEDTSLRKGISTLQFSVDMQRCKDEHY